MLTPTSHVKMWLFLQWGFRLSSFRHSFSTNIPIILLLELLWLRHNQTSPWLDTATIMLILGAIVFWGIEQLVSMGFQCMRRKSDYPNQLSSIFSTTVFLWLIWRNRKAYCYRSTRVLSELLLGEMDFTFLYLRPCALSWILAYHVSPEYFSPSQPTPPLFWLNQ